MSSIFEQFKSRYHESRIQYMATGESPTCSVICSQAPEWNSSKLIFPFLIDNWKHFYEIEFPLEFKNTDKLHPSVLIGIAMAEIYRLCEICTPEIVQVSWYSCLAWESDWWNKERRLKNGEPLGVLVHIPNLEFDESLLMISAPKNIPKQHTQNLNSVLSDSRTINLLNELGDSHP